VCARCAIAVSVKTPPTKARCLVDVCILLDPNVDDATWAAQATLAAKTIEAIGQSRSNVDVYTYNGYEPYPVAGPKLLTRSDISDFEALRRTMLRSLLDSPADNFLAQGITTCQVGLRCQLLGTGACMPAYASSAIGSSLGCRHSTCVMRCKVLMVASRWCQYQRARMPLCTIH